MPGLRKGIPRLGQWGFTQVRGCRCPSDGRALGHSLGPLAPPLVPRGLGRMTGARPPAAHAGCVPWSLGAPCPGEEGRGHEGRGQTGLSLPPGLQREGRNAPSRVHSWAGTDVQSYTTMSPGCRGRLTCGVKPRNRPCRVGPARGPPEQRRLLLATRGPPCLPCGARWTLSPH